MATTKTTTSTSRNARWANDESSFGRRMLMKMGWKQGEGLGSGKSGITTHLPTAKRTDNVLGLGAAETDTFGADGWSSTTLEYQSVLTKLKEEYAKPAKSTKKRRRQQQVEEKDHHDDDDDDDKDYDKEEHSEDVDDEKEKKKKKKKKKAKKKKEKEEKRKRRRRQDNSDQPLKKTGLTLAQNRVSAGHARKMREAKDLSNKSAKDMAAIFGIPPPV